MKTKIIKALKTRWVILALLSGIITSWLIKDTITPFLLWGKALDRHSLPIQITIVISYIFFTSLVYLMVFYNYGPFLAKLVNYPVNNIDPAKDAHGQTNLYSHELSPHTRYMETFIVVCVFGLIIFLLSKPAFDSYFYGEDFNWTNQYLAANQNFLKAIFTPMAGAFFRPAPAAWIISTQLVLPWNPIIHHARNFLFILIDLFLIYRIMLRVTASRVSRIIGMTFFSISKVHLVTIGIISAVEIIATLTHFLLTLFFLIRYMQDRKKIDYLLASVFFVLSVFSRDYSIVLTSVVFTLFFFFVYENRTRIHDWKDGAFKLLPFLFIAGGYLLARFIIVGLPPMGGTSAYSINFSFDRLFEGMKIFMGNLLNLSLSFSYLTGQGDLSTLFTNNEFYNQIYKTGFLVLGCLLFLLTFANGIWQRKWYIFCLVWAVVIIFPTFLIGNIQIYYIYEPVAALAILLSMCVDYDIFGRRALLVAWSFMLMIIAINGFALNQNVAVYWWRYVADQGEVVNRQIFTPNKELPINSLTIITPSQDYANQIQYLIEPLHSGQYALLKNLMSPQITMFRVMTSKDYSKIDGEKRDSADLIYFLENGKFSFKQILPTQTSDCNSFENHTDIDQFTTSQILNTKTSYEFNTNPTYISDGNGSIHVTVSAEGVAENHWGGVELPLPKDNQFTVNLWVDRPEDVKTISVSETDSQGRVIYAWSNNNPENDLIADGKTKLVFQMNEDNVYGFNWMPQESAGSPTKLNFFLDVKNDKTVNYYLDQMCNVSK